MLFRMLVSFYLTVSTTVAVQHGSWIDAEPIAGWNVVARVVPRAEATGVEPISGIRCRSQLRDPAGTPDRAVMAAGWSLVGPLQAFSGTVVIAGAVGADGMCRPLGYQLFVFVADRFAGTLSPAPANAREDGTPTFVRLLSASEILVQYARYTETDPLCCPSRTSDVTFRIDRDTRGAFVVPQTARTVNNTPR